MVQYLVRTNKDEGKTYLARFETPLKLLGVINTDFRSSNPASNLEAILHPVTKRKIAQIEIYNKKNAISVSSSRKQLAAFTSTGQYLENLKKVQYRKITKQVLLAMPEYRLMKDMGLTHAYFLDEKSEFKQVFCFEKDGDISGTIYLNTPKNNINTALKSIVLALAQRIENQDYVYEFVRE